MIIALLIAFVWALACLGFDSYETNKGIKAGVAVEGNWLITHIWGVKPKLWQLWSVDGTIRVLMLLAALYLPSSAAYPQAWRYFLTGGFAAYGLKNIQGGRQWIWMTANPGKLIPYMNTFWEQFIGFWG